VAVEIPEHFIPAFKPAKEFVQAVKESKHELVEHSDSDLNDD
jgi:DNA-binding protein HU-beta